VSDTKDMQLKKRYVIKKTPITPCGRPIGRPGAGCRIVSYSYDPITTRDTFLIFSV
jgi:hypothetical protein